MRRRRRVAVVAAALLAGAGGAAAQGFSLGETVEPGRDGAERATGPAPGIGPEDALSPGAFPVARPVSPILTLDQERLFAESAFGRRVARQLQAASATLAAENRRIERDLSAEEEALTEQRATLPSQEFRALADAFDTKVVALRRAQDAKARALQRREEAERQAFLRAVVPVLADLVSDLGAVAILDDRAVLFAAGSVDVTRRAIDRMDEEIGAGEDLSPPGPVFGAVPDGDAAVGEASGDGGSGEGAFGGAAFPDGAEAPDGPADP